MNKSPYERWFFHPLLFYSCPAFSCVCGLLFALDDCRTVLAVFRMVGCGRKRLAADDALFCGSIAEYLRVQRLPLRGFQQNMAKVFAVNEERNTLYASTSFAIIQPQAITAIVVTTNCTDQLNRPLALLWCHARQSAVRLAFNG